MEHSIECINQIRKSGRKKEKKRDTIVRRILFRMRYDIETKKSILKNVRTV